MLVQIILNAAKLPVTARLECSGILWNGRCENPECPYHWSPKEDEPDDAGIGTESNKSKLEE